MGRKQVRIGDVLRIPLPDGRHGYAQYLTWHEEYGPLIRVFAVVSDEPVGVEEALRSGEMFPPVFVGLGHALKSGGWEIIGNSPVVRFSFPLFRSGEPDPQGKVQDWYVWDGRRERHVGPAPLASKSRQLEMLWGWSPYLLAERIANGGSHPIVDTLD